MDALINTVAPLNPGNQSITELNKTLPGDPLERLPGSCSVSQPSKPDVVSHIPFTEMNNNYTGSMVASYQNQQTGDLSPENSSHLNTQSMVSSLHHSEDRRCSSSQRRDLNPVKLSTQEVNYNHAGSMLPSHFNQHREGVSDSTSHFNTSSPYPAGNNHRYKSEREEALKNEVHNEENIVTVEGKVTPPILHLSSSASPAGYNEDINSKVLSTFQPNFVQSIHGRFTGQNTVQSSGYCYRNYNSTGLNYSGFINPMHYNGNPQYLPTQTSLPCSMGAGMYYQSQCERYPRYGQNTAANGNAMVGSTVERKSTKRKHEQTMASCEYQASKRGNKRRNRTNFSGQQMQRLEELLKENRYPDMYRREEIARELGLQEDVVRVWFKNKRAKDKKVADKTPADRKICESRIKASEVTNGKDDAINGCFESTAKYNNVMEAADSTKKATEDSRRTIAINQPDLCQNYDSVEQCFDSETPYNTVSCASNSTKEVTTKDSTILTAAENHPELCPTFGSTTQFNKVLDTFRPSEQEICGSKITPANNPELCPSVPFATSFKLDETLLKDLDTAETPSKDEFEGYHSELSLCADEFLASFSTKSLVPTEYGDGFQYMATPSGHSGDYNRDVTWSLSDGSASSISLQTGPLGI